MPAKVLAFDLVVFADALLRRPKLKSLLVWFGRLQPYRVSPLIHDFQQACHSPTSLVSVAELFSCSTR